MYSFNSLPHLFPCLVLAFYFMSSIFAKSVFRLDPGVHWFPSFILNAINVSYCCWLAYFFIFLEDLGSCYCFFLLFYPISYFRPILAHVFYGLLFLPGVFGPSTALAFWSG